MKKNILMFAALFLTFTLGALEEHELTWDNGPSVQEYNSALQQAVLNKDWWAVVDYASLISYNFPTSPFAQEASYVMGEAYYQLEQFEYANDCFSAYLSHSVSPKNFENAVEYKFHIAEKFANGTKKRLFGSGKMPAWVAAEEDAVTIFDEVATALPHSELAVKSLLYKGKVQAYLEDYKPSIDTLDLLIRRFPRHELAAEAYLEKTRVYLLQCQAQNLDPDVLDIASVNVRKFELAFPRDLRVNEAQNLYQQMREIFAKSLFETGNFFEKTKKIPASLIYYKKVVSQYPMTQAASASLEKIESLESSTRS